MKHIYYILIIFPLLYEMVGMTQPIKFFNFMKKLKQQKNYNTYTSKQKLASWFCVFYLIWIFLGCISFQWPLFLLIITMSFIPKVHPIITFFDSTLTFSILMFIFMNAYLFQIDVATVISNWIHS